MQKKGILLLNGERYLAGIDQTDCYTVCCDGAYNWAKNLHIDIHIGDFDSANTIYKQHMTFSKYKDLTDGELGLRHLIENGYNDIAIYGGGGGRDDHFFGNLQLLLYALNRGVQAKLITNYATIYCIKEYAEFNGKKNKVVSFAPFLQDVHILNNEGFQYPLKNSTLYAEECRGISNCIQAEKASITVQNGILLVFEIDKLV